MVERQIAVVDRHQRGAGQELGEQFLLEFGGVVGLADDGAFAPSEYDRGTVEQL